MQVLAFILWRKLKQIILGKWKLMEHAHILTIGTARSGLNPDSDVGVGGLILKLTEFLGKSFCLVYHFGGAETSRVISLK